MKTPAFPSSGGTEGRRNDDEVKIKNQKSEVKIGIRMTFLTQRRRGTDGYGLLALGWREHNPKNLCQSVANEKDEG
ncbi:hypothetical protein [Herpetosiphon geysericola]|nr:hypothetical protein [Herpetosiphon geysericola]